MGNDTDQNVIIASLKGQISNLAEQVARRDAVIKSQLDTIRELKGKKEESHGLQEEVKTNAHKKITDMHKMAEAIGGN